MECCRFLDRSILHHPFTTPPPSRHLCDHCGRVHVSETGGCSGGSGAGVRGGGRGRLASGQVSSTWHRPRLPAATGPTVPHCPNVLYHTVPYRTKPYHTTARLAGPGRPATRWGQGLDLSNTSMTPLRPAPHRAHMLWCARINKSKLLHLLKALEACKVEGCPGMERPSGHRPQVRLFTLTPAPRPGGARTFLGEGAF